ncbi:hypothetical protein FD755_007520 [Muntiacus reevesi]|uniref:Large ribosomal subunit protein uL15 n=1 Tax=Muntiacus reevesi TaxID=9886 RepID=A0A5J5MH49_MUNRE|nr:hypothetical protein FD755_007520 [Muntiacus reevesi]
MSHGHSCLGKHQKHPEGQGNAGGMSHHRVNFKKHHPGYSGKAGMRQYHLERNQGFCPTINHDKLWTLVSTQTWVNAAKTKTGAAPITDVGKRPRQPVFVKAKLLSRRAEEKTKGIGAACVLVA